MTRLPSALRPLFPLVKAGVLLAAQVASPITRRVPGGETRPRAPRRLASSAAVYARTHPRGGVTVVTVAAGEVLERPLPQGQPKDHPQFAAHRRENIEPGIVATVRNGRVLDHYAAVVTEDDTLLFDLSPYYGARRPTQHPVFLRRRFPEVSVVPGSVGVLTTRGSDNYYHFLTDVLPRVELLRRAGAEPESFVVNRTARFQRDFLDQLGLTADRCLGSDKYPHLRADQLVVSSLPDDNLKTPRWIVPWLRAQFLPDTVDRPHRRLYVTRGDKRHTRRVENEAALLAALAPLGFEIVDPGAMAPTAQVRTFAEAECVVGPHGAGLTNLAFAPPGAVVVELFARDYVNECFWALASTVEGVRYRYVVGDGTPSRSRQNRGVASDITVDPRRVVALLGELL